MKMDNVEALDKLVKQKDYDSMIKTIYMWVKQDKISPKVMAFLVAASFAKNL